MVWEPLAHGDGLLDLGSGGVGGVTGLVGVDDAGAHPVKVTTPAAIEHDRWSTNVDGDGHRQLPEAPPVAVGV
jgi:hypothetical protein